MPKKRKKSKIKKKSKPKRKKSRVKKKRHKKTRSVKSKKKTQDTLLKNLQVGTKALR